MMKKIALLLLCLLVGCAQTHRVRINVGSSGSDEFSVYMNGEKVCETSGGCYVEISRIRNGIVFDARKDSVVYGQVLVTKETSKNPNASYKNVQAFDNALDAAFAVGQSSDNSVFGAAMTMVAFPVAFAVLFIPSNTTKFPDEVQIPVVTPNPSNPYLWDKPEK